MVELGEQFRLAFSVNAKGTNLKLPDLGDFEVLMGPSTSQSTSFQIINGVSSQSVSFSYLYVLRAKKEGRFNIAPGSITVDGSEYKSNAQSIEVVKGSAKPSSGGVDTPTSTPGTVPKGDLFVKLNLDKRSPIQGRTSDRHDQNLFESQPEWLRRHLHPQFRGILGTGHPVAPADIPAKGNL